MSAGLVPYLLGTAAALLAAVGVLQAMLVAARRRAAVRVTAASVAALSLAAGPAPTFPPAPATARRMDGAPMRRPGPAPAPTDGDLVVRTIVRAGGTEVDVHLIGVRPFSADHPYRWAARTDDPNRPAMVCLGCRPDRGTLLVDLACAPDIVTVTGEAEDRLRYARYLAEQLIAQGADVVAAADVLGPVGPVPRRPRHARSGPTVVFRSALDDATRPALRDEVHATPPITILIGDLPRSRWSLVARPA